MQKYSQQISSVEGYISLIEMSGNKLKKLMFIQSNIGKTAMLL